MKIKVLPPDINASNTGFALETVKGEKQRAIRFGLSAIKNVGKAAIESIITQRDEEGPFKSLDEFARRVNLRVVNRKTMESLIKAGAMEAFGKRNAMLKVLDEIKASGASLSKTIASGQGTLFDEKELEAKSSAPISISTVLSQTEEAPKEEILSWERELLGFYLTEHPLTKVSAQMERVTTLKIGEIDAVAHDQKPLKLGGIIASVRKTLTKVRKEEMCFIKLQDTSGSIEIVVFPKVYSQARQIVAPDKIVIISGKLEAGEETPVLIADAIHPLDLAAKIAEQQSQDFEVVIPKSADRILLAKIYEVLKANPGGLATYLIVGGDDNSPRKIPVPFGIDKNIELLDELENLGCHINA